MACSLNLLQAIVTVKVTPLCTHDRIDCIIPKIAHNTFKGFFALASQLESLEVIGTKEVEGYAPFLWHIPLRFLSFSYDARSFLRIVDDTLFSMSACLLAAGITFTDWHTGSRVETRHETGTSVASDATSSWLGQHNIKHA